MFTIEFKTRNEAFRPDDMIECARILREIADKLEYKGEEDGNVRDLNGNTVGKWALYD